MTTKKKVSKKITKKTVQKPQEKILSEAEMLKIDNLTKSIRLGELEMLAMNQKKKIIDLEFEKDLNKKHNEYKKAFQSKAAFVELLKTKFNIDSDAFSYDPITGEIKDE